MESKRCSSKHSGGHSSSHLTTYHPAPRSTHHTCASHTSPTLQVVHATLGASIISHGFDAKRPQPGICIEKKGEAVRQLVAWNEAFSKGDNRYPTVNPALMCKGSLAATHLNFTLRCFQQELTSTITGSRFAVDPQDVALASAVRRGHLWWILSDEVTEAEAILISEYRNSDNNTSQIKHEIEHIRGIQRVCLKELETSKSVVLSTVLAKAMAHLQVRAASATMLSLAKFVVELGAGAFIDELCEFHSSEINPGELTLPHGVFDEVTKSVGKQARTTTTPVHDLFPPAAHLNSPLSYTTCFFWWP